MSTRLLAPAVLAALGLTALLTGCERPAPQVVQRGYRGVGLEENRNPRTLAKQVSENVVPAPVPVIGTEGPLASVTYQNVHVLGDLSVPEFTRVMLAITQWVAPPQQGCTYCHTQDMSSDELNTKKVARRMLEMTRDINSHWQHHVGSTGVTCYTCHRGQVDPSKVWFQAAALTRSQGMVGDHAGKNSPARAAGLSSLPYDPFTPFLLDDHTIRVTSDTALPSGDRHSIKETEWSYAFMMHISDSLGVNCTYCHNTRSFRDWDQSNPARATAWYGIEMTRALNRTYLAPATELIPASHRGPLGDVGKVDCATCHQGVYKPLFGAAMAADYPELQGVKKSAAPANDAQPIASTALDSAAGAKTH